MNGVEPSCRSHHHTSRGKADELAAQSVTILNDQGSAVRITDVRWIGKGKHRMVFERARSWKRVRSGTLSTGKATVMQLVPAGGSW